jgi:excinuclease ABC subunit A
VDIGTCRRCRSTVAELRGARRRWRHARGTRRLRERRAAAAHRRTRRAECAHATPGGTAHRRRAHRRQRAGAHRHAAGLGLGYLSLERATPTLSPGELQRLRLATQIRSNLFGVVYVLDEPTAGLHPADGEALLGALAQLRAAGNSLFVVEHDLAVMRRADWLVDVGPDAGERGGRVLYSGPPAGCAQWRHRTRGDSCSRRRPAPRRRRAAGAGSDWQA